MAWFEGFEGHSIAHAFDDLTSKVEKMNTRPSKVNVGSVWPGHLEIESRRRIEEIDIGRVVFISNSRRWEFRSDQPLFSRRIDGVGVLAP